MEKPNCECHGEAMYWHKRPERSASGGYWRCTVRRREVERARRARGGERFRKRKSEYNRSYREANRERLIEYNRLYREENRERLLADKRAAYARDPERFCERVRAYYHLPDGGWLRQAKRRNAAEKGRVTEQLEQLRRQAEELYKEAGC